MEFTEKHEQNTIEKVQLKNNIKKNLPEETEEGMPQLEIIMDNTVLRKLKKNQI